MTWPIAPSWSSTTMPRCGRWSCPCSTTRASRPVAAASADEALERLTDFDCDVVLSDIRMPGRTGIELLGEIRELRPDTPVVLMTAFGSIDSAVEAMRAGAFDYVTKPFKRDALLAARSSAPSSAARSRRRTGACAAPSTRPRRSAS